MFTRTTPEEVAESLIGGILPKIPGSEEIDFASRPKVKEFLDSIRDQSSPFFMLFQLLATLQNNIVGLLDKMFGEAPAEAPAAPESEATPATNTPEAFAAALESAKLNNNASFIFRDSDHNAQALAILQGADADGNGTVTKEELNTKYTSPPAGATDATGNNYTIILSIANANPDGFVYTPAGTPAAPATEPPAR